MCNSLKGVMSSAIDDKAQLWIWEMIALYSLASYGARAQGWLMLFTYYIIWCLYITFGWCFGPFSKCCTQNAHQQPVGNHLHFGDFPGFEQLKHMSDTKDERNIETLYTRMYVLLKANSEFRKHYIKPKRGVPVCSRAFRRVREVVKRYQMKWFVLLSF